MTRYIVIRIQGLADFFSYGLAMLLIITFQLNICAQTGDANNFIAEYQKLIASGPEETEEEIDSTVDHLLAINQDKSGQYDSLVTTMLIWHYQYKSKILSEEDRLQLLYRYRVILEKMAAPFHADFARFYGLFIHSFWYNYQNDSIAHYLDLVEQHINASPQPIKAKITWLYEKGRFANLQGDYEASLTLSQAGLDYLNTYFPNELRTKYLLLNAIGIGYRRLGDFDEAIAHYENLVNKHREEADKSGLTGAILNNLGLAYKDCGDWDYAIRRLSDAIDYYKMNVSPTFYDIGSGYDNIAICYQAAGQLDEALQFSQKSLAFIQQNQGASHPDVLLPMCSMMRTLILKKDFQQALSINLKAKTLLKELGWQPDNPEGDYYLADGFDVFAYGRQIERAIFDKTADTTYLHNALEDGWYFMAMTDYAYDNLKNDLSKEIFQWKHAQDFSGCVDDLYTIYQLSHNSSYIESAFAITEKFKSLELLYAAQKDKADHVEIYNKLNQQYTSVIDSIRHYKTLSENTDSVLSQTKDAFSKYTAFKETLYLWKEKTKLEYPDYYQLIYHPEPTTIAELQHKLTGSDQCILSYHQAPDAIYMFVITSDHVHFVRNSFTQDLPEMITVFRRSIDGFFTDTIQSESGYADLSNRFAKTGTLLYDLLIHPVDSLLTDRIVIIVDKALGYIPFDVLVKDAPALTYRFRQYNYLLKQHAISYSYSARLWMDMLQRQKVFSTIRILAMAPDFPEPKPTNVIYSAMRSALQRLYFNEREVRAIHEVIGGKILVGDRATKKNFIKDCSRFPILHLATHSKANDEEGDYSYLAFTESKHGDEKLPASEIYDLHLNAELVTLSACETGLGELRSGEGIISLARAFSFAGAKSIVSSLWSVNDKSTPSIMTAFYQNMKKGLPKDIAMQKAKVDFISSRGHADAHPFYWGSFICVGDMRPMIMVSHPHKGIIIASLSLAAILLLFFLRKFFVKLGTGR